MKAALIRHLIIISSLSMLLSVSNFRRSLKSELIELHPGEEGPLPGVDEDVDESDEPGESKLLPGDKIPSGLNSSLDGGG